MNDGCYNLASKIAEHLPGYTANARDTFGAELLTDNGPTLFLQGNKEPGRITLSLSLPQELRNVASRGYTNARITVSAEREPERIAKEVTRRLLPEAREVYAYCLAKYQRQCAYEAQAEQAIAAIEKATDGRVSEPQYRKSSKSYNRAASGLIGTYYINAEVSGDKVTLAIGDLSAEQASWIIQRVKFWQAEEERTK